MEFYNINEEMNYIRKRNEFIRELDDFLTNLNYVKVDVDMFESYDSFVEQNKRIKPNTMVKLIDASNNISILRPDITTNIIKQVVNKWVEGSKIKLFYDSTIFRQTNQSIEEKRQFGIEQLGFEQLDAEEDVLSCTIELLKTTQIDYKIRLGSQAFINTLFSTLSLAKEDINFLRNAIQAKDQTRIDAFISQNNITKDQGNILKDILSFEGPIEKVVSLAKQYPFTRDMTKALNDIERIVSMFSTYQDRLWVDLSLVTEYDYYNGLLIEGYAANIPTPLFQGGRYDTLTKQYGKEISAFGISFDYQALIQEVIFS